MIKPVSNKYHPVNPESVDVIEWVKKEKPELYQQMLDGVEIGFPRLAKEFRDLNSKNQINQDRMIIIDF